MYIRLCENTATRGNGIDFFRLQRKAVHFCDVYAQKRRHLVDKCARAACAAAVHPFFRAARDENDFSVLSAKFYCHVGRRIILFYRGKSSLHLLSKRKTGVLRNAQPRATRDADLKTIKTKLLYLVQLG